MLESLYANGDAGCRLRFHASLGMCTSSPSWRPIHRQSCALLLRCQFAHPLQVYVALWSCPCRVQHLPAGLPGWQRSQAAWLRDALHVFTPLLICRCCDKMHSSCCEQILRCRSFASWEDCSPIQQRAARFQQEASHASAGTLRTPCKGTRQQATRIYRTNRLIVV